MKQSSRPPSSRGPAVPCEDRSPHCRPRLGGRWPSPPLPPSARPCLLPARQPRSSRPRPLPAFWKPPSPSALWGLAEVSVQPSGMCSPPGPGGAVATELVTPHQASCGPARRRVHMFTVPPILIQALLPSTPHTPRAGGPGEAWCLQPRRLVPLPQSRPTPSRLRDPLCPEAGALGRLGGGASFGVGSPRAEKGQEPRGNRAPWGAPCDQH